MRRSFLLFDAVNQPTLQFADFLRDIGIPGTNLIEIDTALQARFFQKNPDGTPKERWELDKVHITCPPERLKAHLAACGFVNETKPSGKVYDYAAWPGALVPRAFIRLRDLDHTRQSGVQWGKTIVFGGKRPLQADKEGYEQCFKAMLGTRLGAEESWKEKPPQTELEMMQWMWRFYLLSPDLRDAVLFVDAQMKHFPPEENRAPLRPTTEDTVNEWLKSNPKPGSVLLSSGAPYGMAMDEAFWMLLKPHGFSVETFGHSAPDLPIENFMREVAGTVNRIRRARKL